MPDNDPIRHVILLIMEDRSFDHMLGGLAGVIPGLDGVDPASPHVNRDAAGQPYLQAPSEITQTTSDPHHEHANVVVQLQNGNSGFVLDFAQAYPASTVQDRQQIMDYFLALQFGHGRNFPRHPYRRQGFGQSNRAHAQRLLRHAGRQDQQVTNK
jgi:phospholipase C